MRIGIDISNTGWYQYWYWCTTSLYLWIQVQASVPFTCHVHTSSPTCTAHQALSGRKLLHTHAWAHSIRGRYSLTYGWGTNPPSDLMNKINNLLFNVLEADSLHTELPIFTPVTQLGCKLVFIYLFFLRWALQLSLHSTNQQQCFNVCRCVTPFQKPWRNARCFLSHIRWRSLAVQTTSLAVHSLAEAH